MIMKGKQVRIL